MILLDGGHRCMEQQLDACFSTTGEQAPPIDIRLTDYDEGAYRLTRQGDVVEISLRVKGFEDVKSQGAEDVLKRVYSGYPSVSVVLGKVEGFDVTLVVDVTKVPEGAEDKKKLIKDLGLFRRNTLSTPFRLAFEALEKGEMIYEKPVKVQYRREEAYYVFSQADRAVICYSVNVPKQKDRVAGKDKETTDSAVCRIFLQEFDEVRKKLSFNAPIAIFTEDMPLELKNMGADAVSQATGYLQFVFFKRHIEGGRIDKALTNITQFRSYLDYHIKCAKAYMHTRMRNSTEQMLQVLNRAKPEKDKKDAKTMSGKAFVRS